MYISWDGSPNCSVNLRFNTLSSSWVMGNSLSSGVRWQWYSRCFFKSFPSAQHSLQLGLGHFSGVNLPTWYCKWQSAFSFKRYVNLNLVGNCSLHRDHMIVWCVLVSTSCGACIVRVSLLLARISFCGSRCIFRCIIGNYLLKNIFLAIFPAFLYIMQLYNGWSVLNLDKSFCRFVKFFINACSFPISVFSSSKWSWMYCTLFRYAIDRVFSQVTYILFLKFCSLLSIVGMLFCSLVV